MRKYACVSLTCVYMSSLVPKKFMDSCMHVSNVNGKHLECAQLPVIINIIAQLPAIIIAQHFAIIIAQHP